MLVGRFAAGPVRAPPSAVFFPPPVPFTSRILAKRKSVTFHIETLLVSRVGSKGQCGPARSSEEPDWQSDASGPTSPPEWAEPSRGWAELGTFIAVRYLSSSCTGI
eukprot:COSAG06_NODE_263_length_18879_cov_71.911555_1_plen_106_part_00